ncbi:MAG: carboxypeptidase regulatory-like domain-containing protein [Planctomycetota bacterium]
MRNWMVFAVLILLVIGALVYVGVVLFVPPGTANKPGPIGGNSNTNTPDPLPAPPDNTDTTANTGDPTPQPPGNTDPDPTPTPIPGPKQAYCAGTVTDADGKGLAHAMVVWMPVPAGTSADKTMQLALSRAHMRVMMGPGFEGFPPGAGGATEWVEEDGVTRREFSGPGQPVPPPSLPGSDSPQEVVLTAETDATGAFRFEWPASVKAESAGVIAADCMHCLGSAEPLAGRATGPVHLTLKQTPGIRIDLRDLATNKPVLAANIIAWNSPKAEPPINVEDPAALRSLMERVWSRWGRDEGNEPVQQLTPDETGSVWIDTNGSEGRYFHAVVISMEHRAAATQNVVATAGLVVQELKLDPGASVSGRVVDQDGRAVPYANVALGDAQSAGMGGMGGHSAVGDLDGNFTVSGLKDPSREAYQVMVNAIGYEWKQELLSPDSPRPVVIVLTRQAMISGRVKSKAGAFIGAQDSANVYAQRVGGEDPEEGEMRWSGRSSSMNGGQTEWYWVNASGAAVNEKGEVDARLESPGSSGQWRDMLRQQQATRVMRTGISREDLQPEEKPAAPPGAFPAFRLVGLTTGDYSVTATAPEHSPTVITGITLKEGEAHAGLIIQLKRGSSLHGRVLGPDGAPCPGAYVQVSAPFDYGFDITPDTPVAELQKRVSSAPAWQQSTYADQAGKYTMAGMPAGEAQIIAAGRGIGLAQVSVSLLEEGDLEQDVTLTPGQTISGTVLLANGSPALNANLNCTFGEQRNPREMGGGGSDWQRWQLYQQAVGQLSSLVSMCTEASVNPTTGVFIVKGLRSGRYSLTASAEGGIEAMVRASAGDTGVVIKLGAVGAINGTISLPDGSHPANGSIRLTVPDGMGTQFSFSLEGSNMDMTGDRFGGVLEKQGLVHYHGQGGLFTYDKSSGQFKIENIAVGTYRVTGNVPDYADCVVEDVVVAAASSTSVTLTLGAPFRLEVLVVDHTGAAVADATVVIGDKPDNAWMGSGDGRRWTQSTDSGGRTVFESVTIPMVQVSARKDGLATSGVPVDVRSTSVVEIKLSAGGRIVGVVRDAAGKTLGGTMVMLVQPARGNQLQTTCDDNANFTFENVAAGPWIVVAAALQQNNPDDMGRAMKMVTVREGETATVEFGGGGNQEVTVSGTVTRGGEPVTGSVGVFRPGAELVQRQVKLDSAGHYETKLLPGDYLVLIPPDNTRRVRVRVPAGSPTAVVDIELPSGVVNGSVRDRNGLPVPGARIELQRAVQGSPSDLLDRIDRMIPSNSVVTDDEGRFSLGGVAPGSYDIWVRAGGGMGGGGAMVTPDGRQITTTHCGQLVMPSNGGTVSRDLTMADAGKLKIVLEGFPLGTLSEAEFVVRDAATGRNVPLVDPGFGQPPLSGESTTFNHVAPGSYIVRLHVPGAAWTQESATVRAGDTTEVRFVATIGCNVTVTASGPSGVAPLTSWQLSDAAGKDITPRGNLMELLTGSHGSDGKVAFNDLPIGKYTVKVTDVDGHTGSTTFNVTGTSPMDVSVRTE